MKILKVLKSPGKYIKVALERVRNRWRSCVYRGEKVVCEICDWKGEFFFKGKCPNCNALPRTRLIPFALRYFNLVETNNKILHVAPNDNEFNYVKKAFSPIQVYDRLNIRPVKNINIIKDLTDTGLPAESYDLQIIWHVLEHISEDKKAISELYRLLKSGGKLLVSVPIYPEGNTKTFEDKTLPYAEYEKVHGHYDHCRSCGLDYYKRFQEIGFEVQTLQIKDFDKERIDKYGLRKDHVVWCFKK